MIIDVYSVVDGFIAEILSKPSKHTIRWVQTLSNRQQEFGNRPFLGLNPYILNSTANTIRIERVTRKRHQALLGAHTINLGTNMIRKKSVTII